MNDPSLAVRVLLLGVYVLNPVECPAPEPELTNEQLASMSLGDVLKYAMEQSAPSSYETGVQSASTPSNTASFGEPAEGNNNEQQYHFRLPHDDDDDENDNTPPKTYNQDENLPKSYQKENPSSQLGQESSHPSSSDMDPHSTHAEELTGLTDHAAQRTLEDVPTASTPSYGNQGLFEESVEGDEVPSAKPGISVVNPHSTYTSILMSASSPEELAKTITDLICPPSSQSADGKAECGEETAEGDNQQRFQDIPLERNDQVMRGGTMSVHFVRLGGKDQPESQDLS